MKLKKLIEQLRIRKYFNCSKLIFKPVCPSGSGIMNLLVFFLLLATVIMTLGEARRLAVNPGKKINPEETGEDLPPNSRSIRVAGETWPRLDFMERRTQSLREATTDEADRLVSDFWKNFGQAAENVAMEADMTQNVNEHEKDGAASSIVSPSLPQDNTEKESPIVSNEEEVDKTVDDANLVDNNENKNSVIVESRASSQNAPEEIRIPMLNGQNLPPYSIPPGNEYLNRGQAVYPNINPQPNQPYPIVFPTPVLTQQQPRLPFGYPQNGPFNQAYMPTNRSPYTPQQYYPPGTNFRGVPVNMYDPNTNRFVTVLMPTNTQGYPIFDPNPVPIHALGSVSGQQASMAPLAPQVYAPQPQALQTDMASISTPVTSSGYPVYSKP